MFKKTAPCEWDAVQTALDSIVRETVLLQNMDTHTEAVQREDTVHRLAGLSAATYRLWRETNTTLARTTRTAVKREDVSLLLYHIATLSDELYQIALLWCNEPPTAGARWGALLAQAARTLQKWLIAWPDAAELRADDAVTTLFALRREADRLWGEQLRLPQAPSATAAALHRAIQHTAHIADTALRLSLKNT
jgi:hypothetical protein